MPIGAIKLNATEETAFRLRLFPAITKGQFAQEMLCQAVLSALPGYAAVTVNQPLGGRDKGVDVTGRLNGREFIASVSFTAVDDQTKKVRQSRIKKFTKDMDKAEKHAFSGLAFVIFTNINFTDLEKDVLKAEGARRQLSEIVILDCANIAAFLCSPKGLPIRYQFLGIELSETEKNGFFAKVQESMENYVDTRLKSIEAYLDDMMFASEIERSLQRIEIRTAFSSKYSLFFKDRFYVEYRFIFAGVPGVKWLRIIICRSKKNGKMGKGRCVH